MTDKEQIIINGVDVSECIFYQVNFEEDFDVKIKHFCSNWHNSCESVNNSNCYFKQLARSEARIKELEEKLNAQFAEMEEKLTTEEMENFELKEEIRGLKDYIKWLMSLQQ